jgi:hypothetical protein
LPPSAAAWTEIAIGVRDADFGYRPLFSDPTALPDVRYWYRVRAENEAGLSEPSAALGPVSSATLRFVDELLDASNLVQPSPQLRWITTAPMDAKMDRGRVTGAGSSLQYSVPGEGRTVRVDCFLEPKASVPSIAAKSGRGFQALKTAHTEFARGTDLQSTLRPVRLEAVLPASAQRVRIDLGAGVTVGRVELDYVPRRVVPSN